MSDQPKCFLNEDGEYQTPETVDLLSNVRQTLSREGNPLLLLNRCYPVLRRQISEEFQKAVPFDPAYVPALTTEPEKPILPAHQCPELTPNAEVQMEPQARKEARTQVAKESYRYRTIQAVRADNERRMMRQGTINAAAVTLLLMIVCFACVLLGVWMAGGAG